MGGDERPGEIGLDNPEKKVEVKSVGGFTLSKGRSTEEGAFALVDGSLDHLWAAGVVSGGRHETAPNTGEACVLVWQPPDRLQHRKFAKYRNCVSRSWWTGGGIGTMQRMAVILIVSAASDFGITCPYRMVITFPAPARISEEAG